MFDYTQSTKCEDLECLLNRMKAINDIVAFNVTYNLDEKYAVWVERHIAMIEELEFMILDDLIEFDEKVDDEVGH